MSIIVIVIVMVKICYIITILKIVIVFDTFFPLSIKRFGRSYLLVFSEILRIDRNLETEKSDILDLPEKFLLALKWA